MDHRSECVNYCCVGHDSTRQYVQEDIPARTRTTRSTTVHSKLLMRRCASCSSPGVCCNHSFNPRTVTIAAVTERRTARINQSIARDTLQRQYHGQCYARPSRESKRNRSTSSATDRIGSPTCNCWTGQSTTKSGLRCLPTSLTPIAPAKRPAKSIATGTNWATSQRLSLSSWTFTPIAGNGYWTE